MKELTFKIKDIVNAYKILDNIKYTKMSDEDKIKVWKIYRALKPTVLKSSEAVTDAKEKLADKGSTELANTALEEFFNTEVTVEFEPLSHKAFNDLILSNELPLSWLDKIVLIEEQ